MAGNHGKFVKRGSIRLWTERFGSSGTGCLLIGGAGAISAFWPDAFCEDLCRAGHQVIRYDHRDTGLSSFVDFERTPYDLMDLVDDALAILDEFAIRDAHIVGHSMGGFIAQLLAVHHPDRVRSFTSMSSHPASPDVPLPPAETWQVLLANQPCGQFDKDLDGYMKVWCYLNGNVDFDASSAEGYTRELYVRNPATLPARNHVAIQAHMKDRTSSLQKTSVPALIIHGTADPLVPLEGATLTACAIPHASLRVLPDAGHMFFNESLWRRLSDDVVPFSQGVDNESGQVDRTEVS